MMKTASLLVALALTAAGVWGSTTRKAQDAQVQTMESPINRAELPPSAAEQVRWNLESQRRERVQALLLRAGQDGLGLFQVDPQERLVTQKAIARAMREVLGQAEIRRRLLDLGLPAKWANGQLTRLAPNGRFLVVEEGRAGHLLAANPGSDFQRRVLAAFPEMAAGQIVNMPSYSAPPGPSSVTIVVAPFPNPGFHGEQAGEITWDLSAVDPTWSVTGAIAYYKIDDSLGGDTFHYTVTDPFGSGSGDDISPPPILIGWDETGWAFIEASAGVSDANPGSTDVVVDTDVGPYEYSDWVGDHLLINYVIC